MKVGGNAARVFSTYVETNDKLNLLMQVTALLMNSIVLGQVLTYPGVQEKGGKVTQSGSSATPQPVRQTRAKSPKKVKRD
jgi:hypothetical protein